MTKLILITGASGSEKTIIAKYLAEKYQVFHFYDITVPSIDEMIKKVERSRKMARVCYS